MDNPNLPEIHMENLIFPQVAAGVGSARCTAPLNPKRDAAQRVQKRDVRGRTNTRKQEEQRDIR
jgi:hypothetical protein